MKETNYFIARQAAIEESISRPIRSITRHWRLLVRLPVFNKPVRRNPEQAA